MIWSPQHLGLPVYRKMWFYIALEVIPTTRVWLMMALDFVQLAFSLISGFHAVIGYRIPRIYFMHVCIVCPGHQASSFMSVCNSVLGHTLWEEASSSLRPLSLSVHLDRYWCHTVKYSVKFLHTLSYKSLVTRPSHYYWTLGRPTGMHNAGGGSGTHGKCLAA